MRTAHEVLRIATSVVYLVLAVQAVRSFLRDRRSGRAWLATMFGVLGLITAVALLLPETRDDPAATMVRRILVALLVLVPYALFRFTATFVAARPLVRRVAEAITAALAVWIFFEPAIPVAGDEIRGSFRLFVFVLVAQWVGLSAIAVATLWRQRRNQTLVARRRMETMAVGAALFALALIIAGASSTAAGEITWSQIVLQTLTLLAGPLFLIGFAPPALVVDLLRRPELERQRMTYVEMAGAVDRDEIISLLLPRAVEAVGGTAAVVVDDSGAIVGSMGSPGSISALIAGSDDDPTIVRARMRQQVLMVRVGSAAPFFGDQERGMLTALAAITDIATERAELVEQDRAARVRVEAANAALRDFVAAASHDLRTPLTVIRGFSELLSDQWERMSDDDKRTYFDSIRRQTDHLNRIVEDLLTVSRIDAQAVAPRTEAVAIEPLVSEIVSTMQPARAAGIRVEIPDGLCASADAEHVRRMLGNYLDNAFNYGDAPVRVVAARNGPWVEVRVIDSGRGVPDPFVPRLFERFARADKRQSKSAQGTGLGLTIVRGLAMAGGGDAWYEPGASGATFAIRLPAIDEPGRKAG